MRYVEIAALVDSEPADLIAAELAGSGLSVEVRDATTLLKPAPGRAELLVWAQPDDLAATRERIEEVLADAGVQAEVRLAERNEDEWRDVWKQFFTPRTVGLFCIVPSWHRDHRPATGEMLLEIDPGRAFGTGGHASTRLLLEALSRLPADERVLDVGCGSGVLGIACALRREDCHVTAVDVDPEAVATTRENAEINHVASRIEASTTPIADLSGAYDLVLANIQADVLVGMADDLCRLTQGHLILGGILDEQASAVLDRFAALDVLRATERLSSEGWTALVFERER